MHKGYFLNIFIFIYRCCKRFFTFSKCGVYTVNKEGVVLFASQPVSVHYACNWWLAWIYKHKLAVGKLACFLCQHH